MFKRIAALALVVTVPLSADAEIQPGVGFAVGAENSAIYLPINFSNRFRVEPSLRYSERNSPFGGYQDLTVTATSYEVGIGLFALQNGGEKVGLYYGSRFIYGETERSVNGRSFGLHVETFGIEPTFGIEYKLSESFMIGGEAFVAYTEDHRAREAEAVVAYTGDHRAREAEAVRTGSRLTAKFFF